MPPYLSLLTAYALWQALKEWTAALRPPDLAGLVLLLAASWLFALRWSAPRARRPWEATPLGAFLLPLALYGAWLAPCGGLRLVEDLRLPAILGSWLGLAPFLAMKFGFLYGEGALLRLTPAETRRYAARQTCALLLALVPFALVAQAWELRERWLPVAENAPELRAWLAEILDLAAGALVLVLVLANLRRAFGATQPATEWQPLVDRAWSGRGRAPRVWHWPTQGLVANAVALGFGRFRAVLISDRLLQRLEPAQVGAALAHEVAHLRRGHALSLSAGFLGALYGGEALLRQFWSVPPEEPPVLYLAAVTLAAILPVLPALRTLEMQADLDAAAAAPEYGPLLCELLLTLGPHGSRFGIRHLPVSRRVAELQRCIADPAHARAWQRRAEAWRLGLRALFLAGLAATWLAPR